MFTCVAKKLKVGIYYLIHILVISFFLFFIFNSKEVTLNRMSTTMSNTNLSPFSFEKLLGTNDRN
jgi:hypothetical protein